MKNLKNKITTINARRAKEAVLASCTMLCTMSILAVSVFAEGEEGIPEFFNTALTVLKTVVILIGGGLAVWGVINLLEGYGNDNPGAKSQGMKQLMAGIGVALIGILLVPKLGSLFS